MMDWEGEFFTDKALLILNRVVIINLLRILKYALIVRLYNFLYIVILLWIFFF